MAAYAAAGYAPHLPAAPCPPPHLPCPTPCSHCGVNAGRRRRRQDGVGAVDARAHGRERGAQERVRGRKGLGDLMMGKCGEVYVRPSAASSH